MDPADQYDQQLLSAAYWESDEVDIRVNPIVPFARDGLDEFLAGEERLHGHVVFATSGTSGAPKLVCLSRDALLASAAAVNTHLEATPDDRWICALPDFHVGGYGVWARAYQAGGAAKSYQGAWNATSFSEQCQDFGVTLGSLVPVQIFDIVRAGLRLPGGAASRHCRWWRIVAFSRARCAWLRLARLANLRYDRGC